MSSSMALNLGSTTSVTGGAGVFEMTDTNGRLGSEEMGGCACLKPELSSDGVQGPSIEGGTTAKGIGEMIFRYWSS